VSATGPVSPPLYVIFVSSIALSQIKKGMDRIDESLSAGVIKTAAETKTLRRSSSSSILQDVLALPSRDRSEAQLEVMAGWLGE
jgi:hypothetical protein